MIHIAGGVIYNKEKGIVVVNQNNDSWSLPKGHLEENEEPKEAALREIWEETGLSENKLKFIAPLGFYERMRIKKHSFDKDELRMITMYLFTTEETNLISHSPENPEVKWTSIEDVPKILTHEKDKEFFKKIIPLIDKYVTSRGNTTE